ncbi:hypothetical protein Tco_1331840 [Tanacetum coccineum]
MSLPLFTRIVRDLTVNCPFFQQGYDAVGKANISALVKCTFAVRQLAYDAVPDALDEYLQIRDKTSYDCLMAFCYDAVGKAVIFSLVKCTSVVHQLAYGAVPDNLDEYLQIGDRTSRDCLMDFCNGVMELYGEEFLRKPT